MSKAAEPGDALGRLQRVPLREIWSSEADGFTPWPTQHAWLADHLERLHRAFAPRVKRLAVPRSPSPESGVAVPRAEG